MNQPIKQIKQNKFLAGLRMFFPEHLAQWIYKENKKKEKEPK